MVKFGEVVKNANLVERDPEANGVERTVGLEHIDPENLHIRRWNSVVDGTSFTRKYVPGQTLFGNRRAHQRKVPYAEFEGICSGDRAPGDYPAAAKRAFDAMMQMGKIDIAALDS